MPLEASTCCCCLGGSGGPPCDTDGLISLPPPLSLCMDPTVGLRCGNGGLSLRSSSRSDVEFRAVEKLSLLGLGLLVRATGFAGLGGGAGLREMLDDVDAVEAVRERECGRVTADRRGRAVVSAEVNAVVLLVLGGRWVGVVAVRRMLEEGRGRLWDVLTFRDGGGDGFSGSIAAVLTLRAGGHSLAIA